MNHHKTPENIIETAKTTPGCLGDPNCSDADNQAGKCRKSDCVSIACLPDRPPHHGLGCWIGGWGRTNHRQPSNVLREGTTHVLSREYCLANSVRLMSRALQPDEICGGHPDKDHDGGTDAGVDTCQGDSGGPLICPVNNMATIVGIVSWGFDCGREGKPGSG